MINSSRFFEIAYLSGDTLSLTSVTIQDITKMKNNGSDPELMYAVCEILDTILDLKIGESMYFQPNRDNKDSKAILIRKS